ncbi:MAG: site-2 protease family protein [Candidatus Paceibacterota bacterium]|jgi:Zn-dependent protease
MAIFLSLVVLILSVIAHEVAHGYAADSLGDPTARLSGRLTMNPVPHIDPMGSVIIPALLVFSGSSLLFGWAKPVPYNPYNLRGKRWGETFVALAGSATNLLLALIFGLIVRFGEADLPAAAISLAATITFVNLFLGFFNLIPFPPLDGFTALRSALPWHLSVGLQRFEQQVRSVSILSLILFLFMFSLVLSGPFVKFIVWIFRVITGGGA